jgi:hypothetical protein
MAVMSPPLDITDGDTAAAAGQQNLISFNRALTRWSSSGALEESGGAVLCAGGTWIPVVANSAFRRDDTLEATELLGRADAFFAGLGRGYTVKVRDTGADADLQRACTAAGLEAFGAPVPQMIRRSPLPDLAAPDAVVLRRVADDSGLDAFCAVNAEAYATYGMPAEVVGQLFDRHDAVLGDPGAHLVVAWRGADALAAAMAFVSDGVASVQWVGTVPGARSSGLGATVTTAVTNLAFSLGATSVTLQASPMGEPVYRRLGYDTLYLYREYVRWPRPPRSPRSSRP